jgi:hypothetical protein
LTALLTPDQCDAIKDKMTYDLRLSNFKVYCDMYPNLTDAHKAKIQEFLLAAREDAIVAGSAKEKQEKFRLARGRINNYLSGFGIEPKKIEAK